MGRSVTVTGRGRATAAYDEATLRLAASARAANPSDATARATYAMAQMRDAVLAAGADPSALTTTNVSLNPVHDPWPTVVAYEASLGLSVRLLDLSRVGSLLVAAVDAGGDGARVDGITFSHHDAAALEREARDTAFVDARAKAEQYAGLAGQSLGEVRHVVEGSAGGPVAPRQGVMRASVDSGMSIDAGEGVVVADVSVTWALGPAV
jgi:uncharacterized protein YggE